MIYPVILCGGAGTRLWPLSRTLLPKQFLALVSDHTLLQDTVLRLRGLEGADAPLIVSHNEHRFLVAEQMREIGVTPLVHLLEPDGRNTAPAVALAALALSEREPGAVMLVLPADHEIGNIERFHAAVRIAAELAQAGKLATFGIKPDAPATGYGYIRRGKKLGERAYEVGQFVEKPDRQRAAAYLASGDYYWNSGMFVFGAGRYLQELERHRPDISSACRAAFEGRTRDFEFMRPAEKAFLGCPPDSVDYAVMEKTREACVVEADFPWSDIGSWAALWAAGNQDAAGNVTRGDVYLDDSSGSYVRAESRLVAAVGVEDLVIVETADAVLVADKAHAEDVKQTVEQLKAGKRNEHYSHRRVYRPWGYYESIDAGDRFQVKRIMVKPGEALSLQMHHHRAEHWVVVSGTARVTRGEETKLLSENESTYIPIGTKHRLENPGKTALFLIEVQSGGYLGEDDIVRLEDRYKRS
jgi:mannose-1-phosphate guanylyltransferase/mannose-6-phosphate isomerase